MRYTWIRLLVYGVIILSGDDKYFDWMTLYLNSVFEIWYRGVENYIFYDCFQCIDSKF